MRVLAYVRASAHDEQRGLLGYLRVAYGSLLLDGITLRRTQHGRPALSFPARSDRSGKKHAMVRPVDELARTAIEREILQQLAERRQSAGSAAEPARVTPQFSRLRSDVDRLGP